MSETDENVTFCTTEFSMTQPLDVSSTVSDPVLGAVVGVAAKESEPLSIVAADVLMYGRLVLVVLPWTVASGCIPLYSTTATSDGPSSSRSHKTCFLNFGSRPDVP